MSMISDKDAKYMDQIYNLQEHVAELECRIDALGGQAKHYKEKSIHWEETCHAQAETSHQAESDCSSLLRENEAMRVAMDYLLRSPAGVVPSEADRFYDGERATFTLEGE